MRSQYAEHIGSFLLGCWWLTLSASAHAAEVVDFGARLPTVDELEQGLRPDRGAPADGVRARGIRPLRPTDDLKTVSMELTFDFDSARLSERSKRVLENLGAAMERPVLIDYRFRIEGHTDSSGASVYNQGLSERRAESVRSYLLGRFPIPATRLEALGKGEGSPKEGTDPDDPANRRVQITTLDAVREP